LEVQQTKKTHNCKVFTLQQNQSAVRQLMWWRITSDANTTTVREPPTTTVFSSIALTWSGYGSAGIDLIRKRVISLEFVLYWTLQ